jgi:hypothetical protein
MRTVRSALVGLVPMLLALGLTLAPALAGTVPPPALQAPDIAGADQALWPLPFAIEALFYLVNHVALIAGVAACLWLVRRAEDEGGPP